MSAARNQRLAWLSQELSQFKSVPTIIKDAMVKFPNVSEKTLRKECNELLQRMTDIHMQCAPEIRTQLLEQAYRLLEEARSLAQLGPAVNQFKLICQLYGVFNESKPNEVSNGQGTGSPESEIVRERIKQLMKNKSIQERAKEAGIDLDELAKEE